MSRVSHAPPPKPGPVAWMASNAVAANLLMILFVVGGVLFAGTVKQEVFPEVDLDIVSVRVPYPGASPAEVEEGIVLAVEEEVRGVEGVKKVTATAAEGTGVVLAELLLGADADRVLNDIKSAVDRITSLPLDAERPVISLATNRQQVLNVVVYGDAPDRQLERVAERIRSDLVRDPRITLVETDGFPEPEISIEVSRENLRRYGLTLADVSRAVGGASVDLPGGAVRTPSGEVLLRTTEKRDVGAEFDTITVISSRDGTDVRLADIATVVDGYRETDAEAYYDGKRAARVQVFRIGEQSPLEVSAAVREYLDANLQQLPDGISLTVTNDSSLVFADRMGLLLKNGQLGVLLVLIVLGIFLQPKLAFWVTLGLPISILGAFVFIPALGVSINMISLFAFILTLGIVVDDAVVVGESVFKHRMDGKAPLAAAIDGAREVLTPVIFAVLTTVLAFSPLLFVPGVSGKFFENIPLIVIPILIISLVESLLILPAHLAHVKPYAQSTHWAWSDRFLKIQRRFSTWLEHIIEDRYVPAARAIVDARYLTLATCTALLIVAIGVVAGGRLTFQFFPRIEADTVTAAIELPFGAPLAQTRDALTLVGEAASRTAAGIDADGELAHSVVEGIYAQVGTNQGAGIGTFGVPTDSGAHLAYVEVLLASADERAVSAQQFAQAWRAEVGEIAGVERLAFNFSAGPDAGDAVAIQLSHPDPLTLEAAALRLAGSLADYQGVTDIDNGFRTGKPQLDVRLKPAARALGLTERDLALQIRHAFFGAEAVRQQRGRDELRVYVRLPRDERATLHSFENLILRTPAGGEIPLRQAAVVESARSFTEINREDGRRIVTVTADVDDRVTTGGVITASVERDVLPGLLASVPGLSYRVAGEQEQQADSLAALGRGMLFALIGMYALMAVAFRSYAQPIIVMAAIPFGFIGAVIGHLLLGYNLSLISMFGLVALSGVVINDSLVLVHAIDRYREEGIGPVDAVVRGAARRVRPVLLTSLTTFFGLAPMMLETSFQARFLIPMAISLGFGVLFVTGIALVLVPASYLVLEDAKQFVRRVSGRDTARAGALPAGESGSG